MCDLAAACTNTVGGYDCVCKAGFSGPGKGKDGCKDIDECDKGTAKCATAAICTNTAGSYTCKCKAGWSGDGKTCKPGSNP